MEQIALYYPYMVPPDEWVKHALLMHDRVSSIVHPDLAPSADSTLAWLNGAGLWAPTVVRVGLPRSYVGEVESALQTFADSAYRFEGGSFPQPADLTRLYVGKLTPEIERQLLELRVAKLGRFGGHVVVHREVAAIVLAITARYVAAMHKDLDSRVIPSTDSPIAVSHAYDPFRQAKDHYGCVELILDGLLPAPGPEVSIADVVEFRNRHSDELGRFRIAVSRMVEQIALAAEPLDAIRSARDEIGVAVRDLERAGRSRRVRLVAAGLSIIGFSALVQRTVPIETTRWMFDGLGGAASATALHRLTRPPPSDEPYTYLLRVATEYPPTSVEP